MLVDALNRKRPEGSTENTVLGPFHVADAPRCAPGTNISSPPQSPLPTGPELVCPQPGILLCVKVPIEMGYMLRYTQDQWDETHL